MIGKGGSSRVYRVMNIAHEIYAIKRVSLDKTDADTMSGYMNEIALLKRLNGNNRIIRLVDSELKAGPGGSKGHLLLVMECGEIGRGFFPPRLIVGCELTDLFWLPDLARLLQEQQKEPMNMVWISYYWQQVSLSHPCLLSLSDLTVLHRCYKPCMSYTKRRSYILISNRRISCWFVAS
jgi:serine/threonine-protein kinase TTK/MPS1